MKIVAIGDIHGQYQKLVWLMQKLERKSIDFENDLIIQLGELVDGGPDTKRVVEYFIRQRNDYPKNWVVLKGNHEDMMLDALRHKSRRYGSYYQWWNQGGAETALSYGHVEAIDQGTLDWLEKLPTLVETPSFCFVHAGLRPDVPITSTPEIDRLWIRYEFLDSDYDWGKRVVAGHTYHVAPLVQKNKIVIDTMHHGHGVITAAILDDRDGQLIEIVQA